MNEIWKLPTQKQLGEESFDLQTDFRQILEILGWLNQDQLPLYLRWQVALGRFYGRPVPKALQPEAVEYLCRFLNGGRAEEHSGRKLLDWELDADLIVSDVNRAAGCEIRALPYVHWWTFLSWFHSIGPGRLSTVVSIRDKLGRGQKLEAWEQQLYRREADRILMRQPLTDRQRREKQELEALLGP